MIVEVSAMSEANAVYPAHIRPSGDGVEMQTVQTHCEETAEFARQALVEVGLGTTAYLAGLLHDLGKRTRAYRNYLVDILENRPVHKGSVNHTFAGVRFVLEHLCTESTDAMSRIAAEHIAYAIGAHHGLFDGVDSNGTHGFDWRRTKDDPTIAEGVEQALKSLDLPELRVKLAEAGQEIARFYSRIPDKKERKFYSHLVSRLLLSAVIEGDRRSTAEFEHPDRPAPIRATPQLWADCLTFMEGKLSGFARDTAVQQGRAEFSDRCRDFAENPGGIYRLNMPTGAGKTLSSLRYALAHAQRWNKKHILFVMPLLAIIDQNSKVIRQYLGRDDILLEHHSNVLTAQEGEELDKRELLMENWDTPVIITTLVQLLNTMFSHKTASIRRFHSLCDSVIVLDEVQTVPTRLLSLFNQTIAFLAGTCGATVILCSATQPALECAQRPLPEVPKDIVPFDAKLWEPFRRTAVKPMGERSLEGIAEFAALQMQEKNSLLVICNTKKQAAKLYALLHNQDASCFHLSAAMCMAHRRETLAAMEDAKRQGKVLCVSTQIMEAGIDTSFQCVIRLTAGMDSVIQAAGRCNRNGESARAEMVYVISCSEENLGSLPEILAGKKATRELFARPMADYSSAEAIEAYYRIYYREEKRNSQDDYVDDLKATLYDLLSCNDKYLHKDSAYFLNQAYKTAGTHFQVFDEDTVDVAVPYGKGAEWLSKLRKNPERLGEYLKELKPYTISLYKNQREALETQSALTVTAGGILVLDAEWYDHALGMVPNRQEMKFLEV